MYPKNNTVHSQNADDFIGQTFNWLTVKGNAPSASKQNQRWECLCICGKTVVTLAASVKRGNTKSCGCWKRQAITKHGHTAHGKIPPEYVTWEHMITRCNSHPHYHGRGITVCERWKDFAAFFTDMGKRPTPKHSLDRVDNDGDYTPENCRWATKTEQSQNQRSNHNITFQNETLCLAAWAKRLAVSSPQLRWRLKNWGFVKAMTTIGSTR